MIGEAALIRGRKIARDRATSRVVVMRKTGEMEPQSEVDGLEAPEWAAVLVDSPFRLRGVRNGVAPSQTIRYAGTEVTVTVREGHFPAPREAVLKDGDLIEIIAGENAGTVWKIVESGPADQQTSYRVPIIEDERPTEWG